MTKDMTEGSPARLILFFTLPLLAGNVIHQMFALIDTLIVGRFLGVHALAAVGSTGALMFLVIGFVVGLTSGMSICTGQRFGARDAAGVRQSYATCLILTAAATVVMTVVGLAVCRPLLILMQTPPEILDDAYSFIVIIYGCIGIFLFLQTLSNVVRALGDSMGPTVLIAMTLVLNIIFEPIAILVLGWGIPGAALATQAAQLSGVIALILYIRLRVPELRLTRADFAISWRRIYDHLAIGLPMGFQGSIIAIGAVILQVALNGLGPTAIASYAAAQKIESIAMMPMMSFGIAMAAYTAQNFGARKAHRIARGVRSCSYMSVGFAIAAGVLLIVFSPDLLYLFVGDGHEDVIAYGHTYLWVSGVTYWILALLFIFRYTLQGLGDSIVPTIAGIMELIMRALAALILCSELGYLGACLANPMAWLGSCVPLAIAYFWRRRSLLGAMR